MVESLVHTFLAQLDAFLTSRSSRLTPHYTWSLADRLIFTFFLFLLCSFLIFLLLNKFFKCFLLFINLLITYQIVDVVCFWRTHKHLTEIPWFTWIKTVLSFIKYPFLMLRGCRHLPMNSTSQSICGLGPLLREPTGC